MKNGNGIGLYLIDTDTLQNVFIYPFGHPPHFQIKNISKKFGDKKCLHRFAIHRIKMHQEPTNYRELLKGTLGTIILQLLEENKKLYGYEITQLVKTRTEGKVLIKEGSLYPALHKLETDGFVTSEEVYIGKRVRKYYSLTPPGRSMARASVNELLTFMKTIQELIIPLPHVPA